MFLGPQSATARVLEKTIPSGYAGTVATVKVMKVLAARAARDERVVAMARAIVAGLPSTPATRMQDRWNELQALLTWVQRNVRYVQDPWTPDGLERLQYPVETLNAGMGDCDDLAVLYCAFVGALGYPWGFRSIGSDPLFPTRFRHVYALVVLGNAVVPADPTFREALGWEPPGDDPAAAPLSFRDGAATSRRDWMGWEP